MYSSIAHWKSNFRYSNYAQSTWIVKPLFPIQHARWSNKRNKCNNLLSEYSTSFQKYTVLLTLAPQWWLRRSFTSKTWHVWGPTSIKYAAQDLDKSIAKLKFAAEVYTVYPDNWRSFLSRSIKNRLFKYLQFWSKGLKWSFWLLTSLLLSSTILRYISICTLYCTRSHHGNRKKLPSPVPSQQNQNRHVHDPNISSNTLDKARILQHPVVSRNTASKYLQITLEISGGFLGIIPPYFFFTAASYIAHNARISTDRLLISHVFL